jgi:hypothetical protein
MQIGMKNAMGSIVYPKGKDKFMTDKERDDQVEDKAEDRGEKRAAVIELPFCTTEMGAEQARGNNDSEPCDDYREGDYTKEAGQDGETETPDA